MNRFKALTDILEKHEGFLNLAFVSDLAILFSQVDPFEGRCLAYLCTGRLGAPHSKRIPWIKMDSARLHARLKSKSKAPDSSFRIPDIKTVYYILHRLDPIRPNWYPDNKSAFEDLYTLASSLTEGEFKWLINIMLGSHLPNDDTVLRALVNAMGGGMGMLSSIKKRMNKNVPDIGLVAELLLDQGVLGIPLLEQPRYGIPVPLEVMPSEYGIERIDEALLRLKTQTVFVQAKSDGIYVQIQKDHESIFLFDEAGLDLGSLPATKELLNDVIQNVKLLDIPQVIFDTEIVGLDPHQASIISKWDTLKVNEHQVLVFDLVATDIDYRRFPYSRRKDKLVALIGKCRLSDSPGIYLVEEFEVTGAKGVATVFSSFAQQGRYEGVILKNPDSHLDKSQKWSSNRIKIKNRIALDLLLVGYYISMTKRTPTKYLLALWDEERNYYLPCAIAVASSNIQFQLSKFCNSVKTKVCPDYIVPEGKPDFWIGGHVVVEVETDGLIMRDSKSLFPSLGWTLHQNGQRVILSIRSDKSIDRVNSKERFFTLATAPGSKP